MICIAPPKVKDVIKPKSHKTKKIKPIAKSIFIILTSFAWIKKQNNYLYILIKIIYSIIFNLFNMNAHAPPM